MPKKPLTVVQCLPALEVGGVERGTIDVANALVKAGHRSIVISAGGRLVRELTNGGSEHLEWPIGKKSIATFLQIRRLRKWLEKTKPDILHARSRVPAWVCYLAWRKMPPDSRPHFVTSVHGFYSVSPYSAIMTKGEKVIVVSESIREYVLQHYKKVDPEQLVLIYRGVSKEAFPYHYKPSEAWLKTWGQEYPELKNQLLITMVGRLTRWKGQSDFITLIKRLRDQGLDVKGVLVGDGKPHYREELEKKIQTTAPGHVFCIGHRSDIREVMSISNLVVSLSSQPEAFGRTVLEGLYLGVPVLGYQYGGTGEILEKIFPQGLAQKNNMEDAVKKAAAILKQGIQVPETNEFSLDQMLKKTLSLYERLVD